jgi:hypothetical protein
VSILKKSVGVAAAALAATAMMASAAVASEATWVVKKGTNPPVSAKSPLSGGNVGPAILQTSLGQIQCDQTFSINLGTNPGPHPAGVVTGSLTSLTFTNCTDTIPLFNVTGVTANGLPWSGTVDAHPATPLITLNNPSVTISLAGGLTCVYGAASMVADADNANSEIEFINEPMSRTSGSLLCPANGTYTATYSVKDADGHSVEVIHQDP